MPEASKITGSQAPFLHGLLHDLLSALPDFDRIVLHPTRPRQDLLVLELVLADLAARVIKDHAAGACRTLVDCSNEVGHGPTLLRIRLRRSPGSLCPMARSARCDVRPGAAVFVASDETLFWRVSSVFDPFRRLLLQIGGANIAGADRALCRLLRRRSGTEKRAPFLLLSTAARDPALVASLVALRINLRLRRLLPVSASQAPSDMEGDPPGYPREWEADVLLSDGGVAHLRPIRPSDADRLVAFYDRVSPESKYLRFFAPYPRLSDRDVKRFTEVDYVDRVAFIITLGDDMIAVGRYDRIEDDHAEVAFLIEDAHQGRGIAQLLLEHLAQAAREREITRFVAEVLPANRRMAKVFADAGYRVSKGIEDGVLAVEFPILPTDTSVGVMERREHRAESASVRRLLTPERIVVYGDGDRMQGLIDSMLRRWLSR